MAAGIFYLYVALENNNQGISASIFERMALQGAWDIIIIMFL